MNHSTLWPQGNPQWQEHCHVDREPTKQQTLIRKKKKRTDFYITERAKRRKQQRKKEDRKKSPTFRSTGGVESGVSSSMAEEQSPGTW